MSFRNSSSVYIIDMSRTPFLRVEKGLGSFSASDLAVLACQPMLLRQTFLPAEVGEVITGCMIPSSEEANISRIISLRLGCGKTVPAYTVQRNCASGMQALDSAVLDIQSGRHDIVLAGGTDAMSRAPLMFNSAMTRWFSALAASRTLSQKIKTFLHFRPHFLSPEISLLQGLTDHTIRMSMGQTAEEVGYRYHVSRQTMDEYALRSHMRSIDAYKNKHLSNIVPIVDAQSGKIIIEDNGIRADSALEKLAKLKPFFDKPFGLVTPGNSSQITDGAAFMILASEEAVKKYGLKPRAKIIGTAWAGVAPEVMGLGPVAAIQKLCRENSCSFDSIDYWEINEAFSAQVLACLRAFAGEGQSIPEDRLNIYGGAISLGHPVGASGVRIVMQLINVLENHDAKRGIASLCIGGGQGGAMLIERVFE